MPHYDAIVVGARCAGSTTAMLLARAGLRVLVVDKAGFPSDTLSTHTVHETGVACLRRWGLAARVAATNCPLITRSTTDLGSFSYSADHVPVDGGAAALCVR